MGPFMDETSESIASYDTCPTIPSKNDYVTADEPSTYSTARSRPIKALSTEYLTASELAPPSEYVTAAVIPSEESTPHSHPLYLEEELLPKLSRVPLPVLTTASLAASVEESGLRPQDIALPPSASLSEHSVALTPFWPTMPPLIPPPSVSLAPASPVSVA